MKRILFCFCFLSLCISLLSADDKRIPEELFREPEKGRPVVPYHGMRLPPRPMRFRVEGISARKIQFDSAADIFEIIIHFSVPVDPRTLNGRNVLLNGSTAGNKTRFEYNKTGNMVRITIEEPKEKEYSIQFLELKAFNGEPLEGNYFTGIKDGFFFYGEREEWERF